MTKASCKSSNKIMWQRHVCFIFILLLCTGHAWIPCPPTAAPSCDAPRSVGSPLFRTAATWSTTTTTRLGMIGGIFGGGETAKKNKLPALPRDVKEAVSKCRQATQDALQNRISRMDIEFPVGAKFNVEPQPKKKKGSSTNDVPTQADLERSNRELARLFVDMFQPVGGDHLTVVFNDATAADAAQKKWKGDSTAQCRIVSLDRRKKSISSSSSSTAAASKKKKSNKGFAAKLASEIDDGDSSSSTSSSGPFRLPEKTEVCLFVAPGPKELVIVERVCEEAGMGTLVVILNGRLSTIGNFGTSTAAKLFTRDFESVFHLAAFQPQEVAPNCLLHRSYPEQWILARKPKVGSPKTFLVTDQRPTPEEAAQAFNSLEIPDMEKGMEDMVENVAGWFK